MPEEPTWFNQPIESCFAALESGKDGLSDTQADKRRQTFGLNELPVHEPSAWLRLLRQFNNSLVFILLAAALVTGLLTTMGEDMLADTIVILAVVVLNAVLGFLQEGKAESALAALKKMMTTRSAVKRDGQEQLIEASMLVPGDVVILRSGDRIPADLRLIDAQELTVNESALTGESLPVAKQAEALEQNRAALADQRCMAFSGTFVTGGSATALVVATGLHTEFGKIAALMQQMENKLTPLQQKIGDFTSRLIRIILIIGVVNFLMGWLLGYSWVYSFLASVSLVVAAIPEMLPMIVTAILALGATRMAERNALIRRLPAAETLGCTTVICSDKTGTLTRNEMMVTRLWAAGESVQVNGKGYETAGSFEIDGTTVSPVDHPLLTALLTTGTLCNDALIRNQSGSASIIGDPTEGALKVSAARAGCTAAAQRIAAIPFDSGNMFMATLDEMPSGQRFIHFKGAPEQILSHCSAALDANGEVTALDAENILIAAHRMAGEALRVLAMARVEVDISKSDLALADLQGLQFIGLQGMMDPPRSEAITAIAQCGQAGIRTVMITGDHVETAKAIAGHMGIGVFDSASAISGMELEHLDEEALRQKVETVSVFARVAPADKLRIAQALQANGHVIAMTGDGVNDAPALKAADIGIAMGINGTEVTKEAADMILVDDNFATIVGAVEEGRHAWNNLEKAILYTLPTNAGQALLVMGAIFLASFVPLFALSLPLEPIQILWINLFDSVFLTMPLMMEAKEKDLLLAPPRAPDEKLASPLLLQRCLLIGATIALCGFAVFYRFGVDGVTGNQITDDLVIRQAQTAAFWAVLLVHFGFVISARSVYKSAFTFSPFTNTWLLLGILVSFLARLAPTFSPTIGPLFRTVPFPADWWWWIVPCLLPGFLVLEVDKWFRRRSMASNHPV